MIKTAVMGLVFASVFILSGIALSLIYNIVVRRQLLMAGRLEHLKGRKGRDPTAPKLFTKLDHQERWSTDSFLFQSITKMLDQSGMDLSISTFTSISILSAVTSGVAVWILFYRAEIAFPIAVAAGLLPTIYVILRGVARRKKLCMQLPQAFDMINRCVRSGQTVPAAMQMIADDFEEPIAGEFRRCHEQHSLGIPLDTALRDLAVRAGIMELRLFVVGIILQLQSGGNMSEFLSTLSSLVRKRLSLQQRVKALTGEGRMQAGVLMVLPMAALIGINWLAPSYARCLMERPALLAGTACAQILGIIWIKRIVRIDV